MGFLVPSETIGLGLSSLILKKMRELNLLFDDLCNHQRHPQS